ncbi:aminotransferase class V-fold PLP-dependent enzyme [Myxococcota bacterium]|nr:aminotransferase class V-fold PLP-dependent enzyme [Myxococcota bacterium]
MDRAHDHLLDPSWTFLNHGSFGSTPRALLALQSRWREEMEAQPVAFLARRLPGLLQAERAAIAPFLGADPAGLAFVRNATTGVAAVLHSLHLRPGDELLTTDHRYQAVANALADVAAARGARVVEAAVPFPIQDPGQVLQAVSEAIGPRTRLVVVDWITSPTALVLPVAAICRLCRDRGVPILVDGAHSPGHVSVDLAALGADFYTGNLHKWLCAPKGTAVLWAAEGWRDRLHHPVPSHGWRQGMQAELDWTGTDDPTGWLCSAAAVQHHRDLGGATFRAANHALALAGRDRLSGRLDLQPPAPDEMLGCMAALPLPASPADLPRLVEALHHQRIEVPLLAWGGRAWVRISAFGTYNQLEQYDRLGEALAHAL